jgi:hemerythrin-like domain-containing protein
MANVHNIILRGLNSIYLQAPHVSQPADIMDLMFYIKAWAGAVHVHHSHEETILFPRITELAKEAGLDAAVMDGNTEQHHAFEDGLKETLAWAEEVRASKREFDDKALLKLIDSFAPVLTQHLHDEIKSLAKLDTCDAKRLKRAMVDTANAALKDADPVSFETV